MLKYPIEYKTTRLPIPVISKLNNNPRPSTYKLKFIPICGIQFKFFITLLPDIVIEINDMKYINKTIGTGNTNHPKCIRLTNRYRNGIMSANINGNSTAICNKLTMFSSFKIYLRHILYIIALLLKNHVTA